MDPATFAALVREHYTTALGLSAGLFALTAGGLALLHADRKRQIAWWLMGRQSEESWSRSFVAIFDAVFGARHLSLRCIVTSVIASLAAVLLLWVLTGTGAGVQARLEATQGLGTVLAIGLLVNAAADYLSLLETRWLLGRMHRIRHWAAQAGVLLIDLIVTAAIIWAALWAFQQTRYYTLLGGGDGEDLGEVLLLFSPFAVFFYSTFLTSVWVWLYILSTWVMRALAGLRLHRLWDVEKHPVKILSATLAAALLVTGFALSLGVGLLTAKDAAGLTIADRAVCSMTRDRGCLAAAALTEDERQRLAFVLTACEGSVPEECLRRGGDTWEKDGALAAQYWSAGCNGSDAESCHSLGVLHERAIGVNPDRSEAMRLYALAARLYATRCDDEDWLACAQLGYLHENGIGMEPDPTEAARLYALSCDSGHAGSCTNLGVMHYEGIGIDPDPAEAARLYALSCDSGNARGCSNLGYLQDEGIGMDPDPAEAARLYAMGCDGGDARGCTNLGVMYDEGIVMDRDREEAARLYGIGCDGNDPVGCWYLALLHLMGQHPQPDPAEAERLTDRACALRGNPDSCPSAAPSSSE